MDDPSSRNTRRFDLTISNLRDTSSVTKPAAKTKELLLDAAQHMFAAGGVHTVSAKEILAAANQRNASALQYHFGGREGLLFAIIDRHNTEIEAERGELLDRTDLTDLRMLVTGIIVPFARKLHSTAGREFLLIVAQLGERFDRWDVAPEAPKQAQRALQGIVDILAADPFSFAPEIRHERATRFLALVSEALGSRAASGSEREHRLTHDQFVTNLIDMSLGALRADSSLSGPSRK